MKKILLALFIICHFISFGQLSSMGKNLNVDSLYTLLKTDKEDTTKVFHLYSIAREIIGKNLDSCIKLCEEALRLSEQLHWDKGTAYSDVIIGRALGSQGAYSRALEFYNDAVTIGERIKNKKIVSFAYTNIGSLYYEEKEYTKCLEYLSKSLEIDKEINNTWGIARNVGVIGIAYVDLKEYDKALDYYNQALEMTKKIGNRNGTAVWLGNIGNLYKEKKDYKAALFYNLQSMQLFDELGNKWSVAETYMAIGSIYTATKKYKESFNYLYRALAVANSLNAFTVSESCYPELSKLYETSDIPLQDTIGGKLLSMEQMQKRALVFYKRYIIARDSIFGQQQQKKLLNLEFEKKELEAKAEQDKKDTLAKAESKKQKLILLFVAGCLLFVILFASFVFRSLRIRNKQNKIIAEQKTKVETHQKEILDSITYAQRIQKSILPPLPEITKALPLSFILFKPKDIVSGDFYWFAETEHKILIAAADCTGQGVPGAFMSTIGSEKLNEAVTSITDVSDILHWVNIRMKKVLRQSDNEDSTRDGMDIALIAFNKEMTTMEYAGANRPMWIIRKNSNEIEETKANKVAIGGFTGDEQLFTKHIIELTKGDTIYIFTDGYADQFSPDDKKLMTKRFKEMILSINNKPMEEQRNYLDTFTENWKGTMEQTDDILIIGIRV